MILFHKYYFKKSYYPQMLEQISQLNIPEPLV